MKTRSPSRACRVAGWLGLILLAVHLGHGALHAFHLDADPVGGDCGTVMTAAAGDAASGHLACLLCKQPHSGLSTLRLVEAAVVICPSTPVRALAETLLPRPDTGLAGAPRAPPCA